MSHEVAQVAGVFHSADGHTPVMQPGDLNAAKLVGQRMAEVVNRFRA